MPVPKPRKGEAKVAFISRCAEIMAKRDPGRPNKQRLAMCYSSWEAAGKRKAKKRKRR